MDAPTFQVLFRLTTTAFLTLFAKDRRTPQPLARRPHNENFLPHSAASNKALSRSMQQVTQLLDPRFFLSYFCRSRGGTRIYRAAALSALADCQKCSPPNCFSCAAEGKKRPRAKREEAGCALRGAERWGKLRASLVFREEQVGIFGGLSFSLSYLI